jgi:hypothetical protein
MSVPDETKSKLAAFLDGGLLGWLLKHFVWVAGLAAFFWLQLHFESSSDAERKEKEQVEKQAELNKTLTDVAFSLRDINTHWLEDQKHLADLEQRMREQEKKR